MPRSDDTSPQLTVGLVARSRKENEQRLPIHPMHFQKIDDDLRGFIYLEHGYGEPFGMTDAQLSPHVAGFRSRSNLIAECDVIVIPKILPGDLEEMREGQIVWGWPHCVQDTDVTQLAIDRKLTLIAFEAMNHWSRDGAFLLHVFHKNNELAGYCSVMHALQLAGSTGDYGRRLRAAVIGFGATARGAVTALNAHGIDDVRVLTNRDVAAVGSPIHSVEIVHLDHDDDDATLSCVVTNDGRVPVAAYLAENDIVVNCVLQDTESPWTFLDESDLDAFLPGSLIIDVSCDEAMGFSWARPTTFDSPSFVVGDNVHYYAVDHSPSYLWNSSTWEISQALIPHLRSVLGGRAAWEVNAVIRPAIEIDAGEIRNPNILSFQQRDSRYPHAVSREFSTP